MADSWEIFAENFSSIRGDALRGLSSLRMTNKFIWEVLGADKGCRKKQETGQVKCFCDRDSCDDNLLCQGDFCFIGLRREDS
ncbi:hypothetical protein ANCDUO_13328, partial [Ancylostoma duodenale]